MHIYKDGDTAIIRHQGQWYRMPINNWNRFLNRQGLRTRIIEDLNDLNQLEHDPIKQTSAFDPPMGSQEIWAAGVTYLRSKVEREKESEKSGGAQFYDKVYEAKRPELFFKASAERAVGSGSELYIRRDSTWNVPEPELALIVSSMGSIEGYTIGNDLSSRSIEGDNPLYLPQAKTWDKCAALGPCLYLPEGHISSETNIQLKIKRQDTTVFEGITSINQMKRSFTELIEYLFRETEFPKGCFLLTGTGIVPPEDFTLNIADEVRISIDSIGELVNTISQRG